jgi:hypothetical protein
VTPRRPTTLALDFDRTFTSDIEMWRYLICLFVHRGHTVYLVTGRHDTPENQQLVRATLGAVAPLVLAGCVFCNHQPKREVMQNQGIMVDIWIDDLPEFIGHSDQEVFRRLEAQQPVAETLPVLEPGVVDPAAIWQPESARR